MRSNPQNVLHFEAFFAVRRADGTLRVGAFDWGEEIHRDIVGKRGCRYNSSEVRRFFEFVKDSAHSANNRGYVIPVQRLPKSIIHVSKAQDN